MRMKSKSIFIYAMVPASPVLIYEINLQLWLVYSYL